MELLKFAKTDSGKKIISSIVGFGLGTLFRKSCKNSDCIIFKAPSKLNVHKHYKYNNKCYKYTMYKSSCDDTLRTIGWSGFRNRKNNAYQF